MKKILVLAALLLLGLVMVFMSPASAGVTPSPMPAECATQGSCMWVSRDGVRDRLREQYKRGHDAAAQDCPSRVNYEQDHDYH